MFSFETAPKIKLEPLVTIECPSSTDQACSDEWIQIGVLHGKRHELANKRSEKWNVANYEFVFKFNCKRYFSFLLLKKTSKD